MFEKILDGLTSRDIIRVDYELTRRMRRHKPVNPLNPLPQTKLIELPEELLKVADRLEAAVEAKYQTKIDKISDEDEQEVGHLLYEMYRERFRASAKYDPERGKKLVEELRNYVPYHKSLRYGQAKLLEELAQAKKSKSR